MSTGASASARRKLLVIGLTLAASSAWPDGANAAAPVAPGPPVSFGNDIQPLLQARCTECHNQRKRKGKLELTTYAAMARGGADGKVVIPHDPDGSPLIKMTSGPDPEMPPSGKRLTPDELALVRRWIAQGARDDTPPTPARVAGERRPPGPGRVVPRRLSRLEYDNTVRDLLGTSQRFGAGLPEDGVSHGFDRIADTLSISPLHMEQYERAAEAMVTELFHRAPDDPWRRRVLLCNPEEPDASGGSCPERIVRELAARAWRRPVATDELAPFLALISKKEPVPIGEGRGHARVNPSKGLELALQALLLAPDFLFRIELDRDASRPGPQPLSSYELASRVSYFLWSTMPDDRLLEAAASDRLQDPVELVRQVDRMLVDPKITALSADFLGQWLDLRRLTIHTVNDRKVKGWNPELGRSMVAETVRFFKEFLTTPRPLREMLTAPFSFVDIDVAQLYGLSEDVYGLAHEGGHLVRVDFKGLPRAGLLTQPAILTVTSHPDRTSPTGRGQFVLDRVLCEPTPPPPPGVADLEESKPRPDETVREVLARHRKAANCRVCHEDMDSIGLAFEQFDPLGRFRDKDQDGLIDPSGVLAGEGKFNGVRELAEILADDKRFDRCLTKHLLTYAVGRGFESDDDADLVARTTDRARSEGGSLRDTLRAVVTSEPFRIRGGATASSTAQSVTQ